MSLPVLANNTCDIYRTGNAPPAAPDVAAVPCFLGPDFRRGQEAGDRNNPKLTWTHIMLVASPTDVRDDYQGTSTALSSFDTVWVPSSTGTCFTVVFVEVVGHGTPHQHKRVYLDRLPPTWPTEDL